MSFFKLEILTPQKPSYQGQVRSLIVKGWQGFLGIQAHHAPLLAGLAPGPIRIKTDGAEQTFAAGAGLLEVSAAGVTLLVDSLAATQPSPSSSPA